MKNNRILGVLAGMIALGLATPSWGVIISTVGDLDTVLASTSLGNSGDSVEEDWMESVLGYDISYNKIDTADGSVWEQVTQDDGSTVIPDQWAYDFGEGNAPTHYLIKLGGGNLNGDTDWLMTNSSAMRWAHILLTNFPTQNGGRDGEQTIDIFRVSHVATADGTTTVSEPGTLALLGLGLIGFGLRRRRIH